VIALHCAAASGVIGEASQFGTEVAPHTASIAAGEP
jgi:hypothetical protein